MQAARAGSVVPGRSVLRRAAATLELRMLGLAVLIFIGLSVGSPFFLKPNNLLNLLDESVITGIVSIGMTFVILIGEIDLSVGAVLGVTAVLMGLTMPHYGIAAGIVVALVTGGLIGLFSGVMVAHFRLASFVVTLGVMAICRSLAYIFSGETTISNFPAHFSAIDSTPILGLPSNVVALIVLYVLGWLYLTFTKGGRTIYVIGSNREAARTAGLGVLTYSILAFVAAGVLAAAGGVALSAQVLSIAPTTGTNMELDAIAAVVIGGASLYGGRGSMIGTLIGVLIMAMIRNGLDLMGVSPFWQGSAIGGIIILAILVERLVSARVHA